MEEILHQLRLVVYPIIYNVSYIPGGDRRLSEPSTVVPEWSHVVFVDFLSSLCHLSAGGNDGP